MIRKSGRSSLSLVYYVFTALSVVLECDCFSRKDNSDVRVDASGQTCKPNLTTHNDAAGSDCSKEWLAHVAHGMVGDSCATPGRPGASVRGTVLRYTKDATEIVWSISPPLQPSVDLPTGYYLRYYSPPETTEPCHCEVFSANNKPFLTVLKHQSQNDCPGFLDDGSRTSAQRKFRVQVISLPLQEIAWKKRNTQAVNAELNMKDCGDEQTCRQIPHLCPITCYGPQNTAVQQINKTAVVLSWELRNLAWRMKNIKRISVEVRHDTADSPINFEPSLNHLSYSHLPANVTSIIINGLPGHHRLLFSVTDIIGDHIPEEAGRHEDIKYSTIEESMWSEWSALTNCSAPCGHGKRVEERRCRLSTRLHYTPAPPCNGRLEPEKREMNCDSGIPCDHSGDSVPAPALAVGLVGLVAALTCVTFTVWWRKKRSQTSLKANSSADWLESEQAMNDCHCAKCFPAIGEMTYSGEVFQIRHMVRLNGLSVDISETSPGTIYLEPEFDPPNIEYRTADLERLFTQSCEDRPLSVYICHTHGSTTRHDENIARFSTWLGTLGCDIIADIFARNKLDDGIGQWFDSGMKKAGTIVIVCSPQLFAQWLEQADADHPTSNVAMCAPNPLTVLEADHVRKHVHSNRWRMITVQLCNCEDGIDIVPPCLADRTVHKVWTEHGAMSFLYQLFSAEQFKLSNNQIEYQESDI